MAKDKDKEIHIFRPQKNNVSSGKKIELGKRKNTFIDFLKTTKLSDAEQEHLEEASKFDRAHKKQDRRKAQRTATEILSTKCTKCKKTFYISRKERVDLNNYLCDTCIARGRR